MIRNEKIESFDELKKKFDELLLSNSIFRGYNKDEEMFPVIMRNTFKQGNERELMKIEKEMLTEFEQYSLAYFTPANETEFLSYAQHYGLPTRLLDFTRNPFIALFFSMFNETDEEYYKILICPEKNYHTISNFDNPSLFDKQKIKDGTKDILDCFVKTSNTNALMKRFYGWSCGNSEKINLIEPNYSNIRILMQQGLFVIPLRLNRQMFQDLVNTKMNLILINKELRNQVLNYLDKMGFNTQKLMPDLSSLCYSIKRKYLN